MKTSYLLIVVLAMAMSFFAGGCAQKAQPVDVEIVDVTPPPPAPAPAPVPAPAPAPVVQTQAPAPSLDDEIKAFQEKLLYFDLDKSDLKADAQETLNQQAVFLKANQTITIQIAGNCDERGTVEYNLALGEKRAKAAADFLVSLGIVKERISTISYGKEKPIDPGNTEEAWTKNRNDQFLVVNK